MRRKQTAKVGVQIVLIMVLFAVCCGSLNAKEEGTAAQRAACTPDVFRFCTEFIPNHEMIANCLQHNLYRLNKQCRAVFEGRLK